MKLRDYQVEQIERVKKKFQEGNKKVGLQLPTGSGKTEIAIQIINDAIKKNKKVVFVISSIDLIDQTYRRFANFFNPQILSIIRSNDHRRNELALIHILSIDTYVRRSRFEFGEIDSASLIIVDEAHETVAKKYNKFFDDHKDKYYLGLSATFQVLNQKPHTFWDCFIADIDGNFLNSKSYLPDLRIYAPDIFQVPTKVSVSNGDYNLKELQKEIERSAIYSDFITNFKRFNGMTKNSIVFCVSIKFADNVYERLKNIGFKNPLIYHSKLKNAELKYILSRLKQCVKDKEPFSLVTVDKVSKGFDLPSLDLAFMLRPTKSIVKYRQQAGRLTRGKKEVLLIDMTMNSMSFDHPYLLVKPESEVKKRKAGKADALAKRCKSCFAINPLNAKVCFVCSEPFQIVPKEKTFIDAELKEMQPISNEEKVKKALRKAKFLMKKFNLSKKWAYYSLYKEHNNLIFNKARLIDGLNRRTSEVSK